MHFTTGNTPEADMAENGHGGSSIPMVSLENSKVNVMFLFIRKLIFRFQENVIAMRESMLFCCFNNRDLLLI